MPEETKLSEMHLNLRLTLMIISGIVCYCLTNSSQQGRSPFHSTSHWSLGNPVHMKLSRTVRVVRITAISNLPEKLYIGQHSTTYDYFTFWGKVIQICSISPILCLLFSFQSERSLHVPTFFLNAVFSLSPFYSSLIVWLCDLINIRAQIKRIARNDLLGEEVGGGGHVTIIFNLIITIDYMISTMISNLLMKKLRFRKVSEASLRCQKAHAWWG